MKTVFRPLSCEVEVSKMKGGVEFQIYQGYSNSSLQSW